MESRDGHMGLIPLQNTLEKIVNQDAIYWHKRGNVEEEECKFIRLGNCVQRIHDDYRKFEPEEIFDHLSRVNTDPESLDDAPSVSAGSIESNSTSSRAAPRDTDPADHRTQNSCGETNKKRPNLKKSTRLPNLTQNSWGEPNTKCPTLKKSTRLPNWSLYRSASLCCNYPVLVRTQEKNVQHASKLDVLPKKDKNRSVPECLTKYLQDIFGINTGMHKRYQTLGDGGSKQEKLEKDLIYELTLLETNSNPYYNRKNFQSTYDYMKWQERERIEIGQLLNNKIRCGRRPDSSHRNRRDEYKELLKRALAHDCQHSMHISKRTDGLSGLAGDKPDSSVDHCDEVLSKWGRRLLGEYAARYRVSQTSQICCYVEAMEECINENLLQFDILAFDEFRVKLAMLLSLVENDVPACISDTINVTAVIERVMKKIEKLVSTLFTEWLPTTKQFHHGIELARTCAEALTLLSENEGSNWPMCLSDWFQKATLEKYHSCKLDKVQSTPEAIFGSIKYAVEVLKRMENQEQTNYEAVLSKFCPNVAQGACLELYRAVSEDVDFLAKDLTSAKCSSKTGHSKSQFNVALDLKDIALAYRLDEFDKLKEVQENNARNNYRGRIPPWREAYHQLAMHWLDVLSCCMRKDIEDAIKQDTFCSPQDFPQGQTPDVAVENSSSVPSRFRMGSLLKKDIQSGSMEQTVHQEKLEILEEESQSSKPSDPHENDSAAEHNRRCNETSESKKHTGTDHTDITKIASDDEPSHNDIAQSLSSAENRKPDSTHVKTQGIAAENSSCEAEENSSEQISFQSCVTAAESSNIQSVHSTSNCDSRVSCESIESSTSSTVVSDNDSCDLPQLVDTTPHSLEEEELECSCYLHTTDFHFDELDDENVFWNVSTSLIDLASIISRFLHFVRNIVHTIYTFSSCGNYVCIGARRLAENRNHFVYKAIKAISSVVQQFSAKMLSFDLPSVPEGIAKQFISRELLNRARKEIYKTRGVRSRPGSMTEVNGNKWDDDSSRESILRTNNLLAVEFGLNHLWQRLDFIQDYQTIVERSSSVETRCLDDVEVDQDGTSSCETTEATGSTITAIRRDSNHIERDVTVHTDLRNAQGFTSTDYLSTENASEDFNALDGQSIQGLGQFEGIQSPETCAHERSSGISSWTDIRLSMLEDSTRKKMEMMELALKYIKKSTYDQVHGCVIGVAGILSIRTNNWILSTLRKPFSDTSKCGKNLSCHFEKILDWFMKWAHKEALDYFHTFLWKLIIQELQKKIKLIEDCESDQTVVYAERIRQIFDQILIAWHRHPSMPKGGDLHQLTDPIRAFLTLLEFYTMPTNVIIKVFKQCNQDNLNALQAELSPIFISCVRRLQDRKSFSGLMLHETLTHILKDMRKCPSDANEVHDICQKMLDESQIQFIFKNTRRDVPPVLVLCQDPICSTTVDSVESSMDDDESISDSQKNFHRSAYCFYEFCNTVRLSVIDAVSVAANRPKEDAFLIEILRARCQNDVDAKEFLLEKGFIRQGFGLPCFGI